MIIRSCKPSDYEALSKIWNRVYPEDKYSPDELAYQDQSFSAPCKFERFIVEDASTMLASASYAQYEGMYHPQKFYLQLFVGPKHEKKGIGSLLYAHLHEALQPFDPLSLTSSVKEDHPHALRFAQSRGFKETKRDWESVLTMQSYDPKLTNKKISEKFQLCSLAELGNNPNRQRAFYQLFGELRLDVPRSEPATEISYEHFQKTVLEAPDFFPEGVFFALDQETLIGMTIFWRSQASKDWYTGLTGVKRAYRGQGIATALKLKALSYAKNQDVTRVYTDNDTNNVEMIAINDKLGFKKLPAFISMRKEF